MTKLTARHRNALPAKTFAGPNRSFPINDANHARAALSGATRAEKAGNISPAQKATIVKKADAKLGKDPHQNGPKGHYTYKG